VTVYLVGAGPGDPGLLTLRGAELLRECDVVVHDRLIGRALLDMAPAHAERIDVGKASGSAPVSQDEINAMLVKRGRAGLRVVRLKGGDPFVFARGGEEALALLAAGVPFEYVPGVSSSIAAPAAAGIPLTLRSEVQSFTVVTGHQSPSTAESANWAAIAATGGTIVILMGAANIGDIATRLQRGGLAADTPAVAVRWATTDQQEIVRATLATIAQAGVHAPATIVVGSLAALDLRDSSSAMARLLH
jgi:uroporphyrinogen III methyltransferase / synthase